MQLYGVLSQVLLSILKTLIRKGTRLQPEAKPSSPQEVQEFTKSTSPP